MRNDKQKDQNSQQNNQQQDKHIEEYEMLFGGRDMNEDGYDDGIFGFWQKSSQHMLGAFSFSQSSYNLNAKEKTKQYKKTRKENVLSSLAFVHHNR